MKAKKIMLKIVITLIVLGALGGTFALLWFNTNYLDFLKPAKEAATEKVEEIAKKNNKNSKTKLSNILNTEDLSFSDYSTALDKYKKVAGKPVKTNLNITAKLNLSELDNQVQSIINNSKITYEASVDPDKNNSQNKIGLYSGSSEVLKLDLVTNDKKFGIGCDALYDKYLSVTVDELIDYLKKNNSGEFSESELEILSNLGNSKLNIYDLLYVSDEDLKHLDDTYGDIIGTSIPNECITEEGEKTISVDGKNVKASATYITMTGDDMYKFLNTIAKTVKDDSVISKIISEKVNMIAKSAGQDEIKQSEIKSYIDDAIDDMLSESNSLKGEKDSAVRIAIYSDGSKTVRVEVNAISDINKPDNSETLFTIENSDSKNIYTMYNNGKEYMSLTNVFTKNTAEEKAGTLTLKSGNSSIGTAKYEIIEKSNEEKISVEVNVPLASVTGKFEIATKGDYTKEPVDLSGVISFAYGRESAEIKFDGTMEYGNVSIPTLNSSNSVAVLSLSEDESKKLLEEIQNKAANVLPDRLKLIGINVTKEDILGASGADTVEETTENDSI